MGVGSVREDIVEVRPVTAGTGNIEAINVPGRRHVNFGKAGLAAGAPLFGHAPRNWLWFAANPASNHNRNGGAHPKGPRVCGTGGISNLGGEETPQLFCQFLQRRFATSDADNMGTLGRQRHGRRPSEAPAGAGDYSGGTCASGAVGGCFHVVVDPSGSN